MIINLGYHDPVSKLPPIYSYSGRSEYTTDGAGNWELKLLTSGDLKITNGAHLVDIFLIGGGGLGAKGQGGEVGGYGYGGGGGGGGQPINAYGIKLRSNGIYSMTIGDGGYLSTPVGKESYIVFQSEKILKANGGPGGNYTTTAGFGNGGRGGDRLNYGGGRGGDGVRAFGASTGYRYGAGGGGGAYYQTSPGAGGADGGGGGSNSDAWRGYHAAPNSGSGGGGGGSSDDGDRSDGGNGGSGIIIIRNAR